MEICPNTTNSHLPTITIPESTLSRMTYNQQILIKAILGAPQGILSRYLTHKTGISNKSDICNLKLRDLLKDEGLEIHTQRDSKSKQWLWSLRKIEVKNMERTT